MEDFIAGLTKAGVEVNRKMLADLAVNDAVAFAKLVTRLALAYVKAIYNRVV